VDDGSRVIAGRSKPIPGRPAVVELHDQAALDQHGQVAREFGFDVDGPRRLEPSRPPARSRAK
jgi:hypothetical protein